jgi:hypothetical protein
MINATNAGGVNITELRARYAEMKARTSSDPETRALPAVKGLSSRERSQVQQIVQNTNLSADEAVFKVKEGSFGAIFRGLIESGA